MQVGLISMGYYKSSTSEAETGPKNLYLYLDASSANVVLKNDMLKIQAHKLCLCMKI